MTFKKGNQIGRAALRQKRKAPSMNESSGPAAVRSIRHRVPMNDILRRVANNITSAPFKRVAPKPSISPEDIEAMRPAFLAAYRERRATQFLREIGGTLGKSSKWWSDALNGWLRPK